MKDHRHTLFPFLVLVLFALPIIITVVITIILIIYLFAVADFEKIFKEIVSIDSPVVREERLKKNDWLKQWDHVGRCSHVFVCEQNYPLGKMT